MRYCIHLGEVSVLAVLPGIGILDEGQPARDKKCMRNVGADCGNNLTEWGLTAQYHHR